MRSLMYPLDLSGRGLAAALVSVAAFALAPACSKEPRPQNPSGSPAVTLAVLTGLQGTTEPCGCTSDPLGGLDRTAAQLERLRREGPVALVVVGNTFFENPDPPAHLLQQERSRAEAIAKVLAKLAPTAILVGPNDTGMHWDWVQSLAERYTLPLFAPPRTRESRNRPDSVLQVMGGIKLAFIGVPGEQGLSERVAYSEAATSMRAQGAHFVVGLLASPHDDAVPFAERTRNMNLLISGGGDPLATPRVGGHTLVVEASNKGQYLGLVKLHLLGDPSPTGWVFNDRKRASKDNLRLRIEALQASIERMPEGEGRVARQAKLAELEEEMASIVEEVPTSSYVTWDTVAIRKKSTPAAPWATQILADYNRSLCSIAKEATANLQCPPALSPEATYVGNGTCQNCHPDDHAVYVNTRHATAWKTLTDAGKECDVGCIGCHTVGFEQPGGYCRLEDAVTNANVGCENCHGPGGGHAAAPFEPEKRGASFVAKPGREVCITCHNPEHSDLFNFETYLPKVLGPGHGQPLMATP